MFCGGETNRGNECDSSSEPEAEADDEEDILENIYGVEHKIAVHDISINSGRYTIVEKYHEVDAEEARRVRFIMREMLENSGNTNLGDLLPFLQWVDFMGLEKRFKKLMEKLDKFMQDLVNERRQVILGGVGLLMLLF
ncbi:hypothetical protein RD792_017591 [Penstemon davidsonii]|uniref:Uncharacterized protein n=1 Tax=Penstemon davidsonii TaxID=160366 RepID=A0ABR0CMG0_9LAMI|nr:hypothetical protein RD792_017591 [Penstemon davidsonii]